MHDVIPTKFTSPQLFDVPELVSLGKSDLSPSMYLCLYLHVKV